MIKFVIIPLLLFLFDVITHAQVADSFYTQGSKYYNENKKELAKECLLNLINRQMTHNDSTNMQRILGYAYYMNLSYDLLKTIFFEEKDYVTALSYNDKQYLYKTRGSRDFFEIGAAQRNRDSFSAECYYAMKDYKNAMEVSARHVFAERMSFIFVSSAISRFSKRALKEEFMEEFGKIPVFEWNVKYDSSDIKHVRENIYGPRSIITLNIFGYELNLYLELSQIENDLIDNKITQEIANNRIRDEIKKMPIYKLIMEN